MSSKPSDSEPGASAAAQCDERCRCALRRLNRRLQARWLVGFVRSMPVLYDPRHPRHRDAALTELLWAVIGRNLGLPGKTCEKEWKKLCASYKRALDDPHASTPSLFWQLYFLRDDALAAAAEQADDALAAAAEQADDALAAAVEQADDALAAAAEQADDALAAAAEQADDALAAAVEQADDALAAAAEQADDEADERRQELASASSGAAEEESSWAGEPHLVDSFLERVAGELKLLPPYELSLAMDEISRAARKYTPKARGAGDVKLTMESPD